MEEKPKIKPIRCYKVTCSMEYVKTEHNIKIFRHYNLWNEENIYKRFYIFREELREVFDIKGYTIRVYLQSNYPWIWYVELAHENDIDIKDKKLIKVLKKYMVEITDETVVIQTNLRKNIEMDSTVLFSSESLE